MNAPTITGFRLHTDDQRTLFYEVDEDLTAKLKMGGFDVAVGDFTSSTTAHVLISLDVDGEPSDVVSVILAMGARDVETLDRAIEVLQAARDGLLS